jgi:uncharacterized protein YybS (DUF2232 family)
MKSFVILYACSLVVVGLLLQKLSIFPLVLSLLFLPTVIVMGTLYKKMKPAKTVIMAGFVTLLGELLIMLLIAKLAGSDPIGQYKTMLLEAMNANKQLMNAWTNQDPKIMLDLIIQMIPMGLISFSLYFVLVTHGVSRWLIVRSGIQIPGMKPLREWMLPKSFVWMFLIVLFLDLFIKMDASSMFSVLLLNVMPLLMVAFAIQAISFLFFVSHANRWLPILPIAAIVLLFIAAPLLLFVYSILGFIDASFPIRARFQKKL